MTHIRGLITPLRTTHEPPSMAGEGLGFRVYGFEVSRSELACKLTHPTRSC